MEKRKYDSSVARMAGNIAAGLVTNTSLRGGLEHESRRQEIAAIAVDIAERIVTMLTVETA